MTAQAEKTGNDAVLKGPKSDKKHDGEGKKFNGERKRGGDAMHKLLSELKLSDDQKEQVKDIMVTARTARSDWYKNNNETMSSLQKEMKAAREAKDQDKAKSVAEQMKELRSTLPKPAETTAKVRTVLTEEQQVTFDAQIEKLKERRMGAKGNDKRKEAGKRSKNNKGSDKNSDKKSDSKETELDL